MWIAVHHKRPVRDRLHHYKRSLKKIDIYHPVS
jgi:hypothetical protein